MTDNNYLKTIVLTSMLIESLDELEEQSDYKHKLKFTGGKFKVELENYCNKVFDQCNNDIGAGNYILEKTKQINKIIQ